MKLILSHGLINCSCHYLLENILGHTHGRTTCPRTVMVTAKWNLLSAFRGDNHLRKPSCKVVWQGECLWKTAAFISSSQNILTWKRHLWWVDASGMESGLTSILANDFISSLLLYFGFFKPKAMLNPCSRLTSHDGDVERQWFLPICNYRRLLARVSREMGLCYNLGTWTIKIWVGAQFHLPWLDLCAGTAAGLLLCLLCSWLWPCVLQVHLSN